MKILLKNAHILDSASPYHDQVTDILVEEGKIATIGKNLKASKTIDINRRLVIPGLFDLCAHFNEPGFEHKEDCESGSKVAASSGFTDVCLIPNTQPVLESKSDVKFIQAQSQHGVNLHVLAAVSEGCKGENLTEILDLNAAGAVAFTDGLNPIWNSELLLKALQYVKKFDGLIIQRPKDAHLSQFAQMHEGKISTMLGLRGEPHLSEVLMIQRDLEILEYSGGKIHFTNISTADGVKLIRKAKKSGLEVTCDIALHQLLYTDEDLTDYNSNLKVDPPFRTKSDQKALLKGLEDGTIDAIASAHQPQDPESKEIEFDLATPGISSMSTFISDLLSLSDKLPLELLISKLTSGPRQILGLEPIHVAEGSLAKLAVINKSAKWILDEGTNFSKSKNNPKFGSELLGRCEGVVNDDFAKISN